MILNFALSTDEKFVIPALVCITSIFENNRNDECFVYVLTEGLSDKAIAKFNKLASAYHQQIVIRNISAENLQGLVQYGRFPLSMYFRFMLPYELEHCEKVLYIDCDIIVRHSLRDLFSIDLNGFSCAAVIDQNCDDIRIINRLEISSPYFNSGVMLINLDYWRNNFITRELTDFIRKKPSLCIFPDQDALNKVLSGTVKYIDYTYNYQEFWIVEKEVPLIHYIKLKAIQSVGIDPAIVHFCSINKPWYKECCNPFQKEFVYYAKLHPFVGFHVKKRRTIRRLATQFLKQIHSKLSN